MNLSSLQTLTWSTVAAAIASALALAAVEPVAPRLGPAALNAASQPLPALPSEPTSAGPAPQTAASAAGERLTRSVGSARP